MARNTSSSSADLASICLTDSQLKPYLKNGLGGLRKSDRSRVKVPYSSLLTCSIDLDASLKHGYPQANRWDYAIEYDRRTYFLEVHPASTSEINSMIQKVEFLERWAGSHLPKLLEPQPGVSVRCYYWIASGSTDLRISQTSPQARKLAMKHIKPVGRIWDYSKLIK